MAKRIAPAQLDAVLDTLFTAAGPDVSTMDPGLIPLLAVAGELRDLPRSEFKEQLKSALLRKAVTGERMDAGSVATVLHVRGADRLIDFLKRAFFAEEVDTHRGPDGTVLHAQMRIGGMALEMGEAHGQFQPMPTSFHLYVNDADATYRRAIELGAASLYEPSDMPYGDREAGVVDPAGNQWYIGVRSREAAPKMSPGREGFRTVTPYLVVRRSGELLAFVKQAFDAVELLNTTGSAGGMHAEVRIGDSIVMLGGGSMVTSEIPAMLYLYVSDVDAVFEQAVRAGATAIAPPTDQPYGDRNAHVVDPFGNTWYIATHKKTAHG